MPRRILLILSAILLASALPAARPASAQGEPVARLITECTVPNISRQKFPFIAVRNGVVHLASNNNEDDVFYWNKPEAAACFDSPFRVGAAIGQGDYSSPAMFVTPDNSVYYAWSSIEEKLIKLRVRDPSGNWGPERQVASNQPFGVFTRVAVSQGRIFVIWQDINKTPQYKTSTDGGVTWSAQGTIGTEFTFSAMGGVAVGPNGEVAFIYNTIDYEINVAFWNGSGFNIEEVTGFGYARPSISYGPDGALYAAFGGIEDSGALSGPFFARRQSPGNWAVQRLADQRKAYGNVNVVVDNSNNVHFSWISDVNGGLRVNYGLVSSTGARSTIVSSSSADHFQAHMAVSDVNSGLTHIASERFEGNISRLRYLQFEGRAAPPINAVPEIEGNNQPILPKDSVSVAFAQVTGSPNQLLWNWGAPPTEADNDSGGWQSFTNPRVIPLPADRPTDCRPLVLFTKVRNGNNIQPNFSSDNVRIDGQLNAAMAATNPYMQRKSPIFTDAVLDDLGSNGGASDGAPTYTRAPLFYLELRNLSDCTGLKDVATGPTTGNLSTPVQIENGTYANIVPFPTIPSPGPTSVVVRLSDGIGNTKTYTPTFIYDTGAPVLTNPTTATFTTSTNAESTLLVNLNFGNLAITDDFYPSPGYWGVWIANSRTEVANPASDTTLLWTPVRINNGGASATVSRWSIAAGLTEAQVTTGDYHVYVRFLDGAGNPTSAVLKATVNISAVTRPAVYLPLVVR